MATQHPPATHQPIPAAGVTIATDEPTSTRCVSIYSRFNRLWHWSQALSIFILIFTGLRIASIHTLMPYKIAVAIHTITALALLLLWAFATFWLFTTGTWKQFVPRADSSLFTMARFYAWGVFRGEAHPYHRVLMRRHNPLQALTYFLLKMVLFPAIWITGVLYLSHGLWNHLDNGSFWLTIIANIHIFAGFAIATFVAAHVYLLTIGKGFRHHVKPMVTGFDMIDLTKDQIAYLEHNEPGRLHEPKDKAFAATAQQHRSPSSDNPAS